MAENEEQLLKEAKKLSWEDRLAHKNWKVRQDAYTDIASNCEAVIDPKDSKLKEYGPLMRKVVADANAAAQEKGLDALLAYLQHSDTDAGRFAKDVCNVLVQKCFTGRTKTIQKATDAFLMFVELEAQEAALEAMLKGFEHKLAKVIVPIVDAIYVAVNSFGTKVVDAKLIMKALVPPENKKDPRTSLFEHQDQKVRASAKGLTVELCRWVSRPIVQNVLVEKMRDAMKKEMEAELDKVPPGVPVPTRRIRSEQAKVEAQLEAGIVPESAAVAEAEAAPQIDEYDLYEPVDILSQIKPKWFDAVKASKWSDRKEAVAELTQLASAKKLQPGDYTEVNRVLKKLIADINVAVCVEAVTATGNLARGLRKDYSSGARLLLPVILEKFKEKKPNVVKALQDTLQAMHKGTCIALGDIIEELKGATKHKVPSVRSETVSWITFCLENSNKATITSWHKPLVPLLIEALSDGDQAVRDGGFSALAAIGKSMGMGPLKKELEKMDEVKKKKLQDMVAEGGGAAAGAPAVAGEPSSSSVVGAAASGPAAVRKSAASAFGGSRPALTRAASKKVDSGNKTGGGPAKKEGKAGGGSKPAAVAAVETDDDIQVSDMSPEELESKVAEFVKPELLASLKSANWKERLDGVVALTESVKGMGEGVEPHTELLVRLLVAMPGWNEKNFQVSQRMFELLAHLAQTTKAFSKRCVLLCLPVAEKVADIKLRVQSCACLTAFCEAVGPQFVFKRLYTLAKEHKNVKVHSETMGWMAGAIDEFGTSLLQIKPLLDFCVVSLENSNAPVRTAATKLLGILHKYKGPDLEGFLTTVKPALMNAIKDEFQKNPYEGPAAAAPKRAVRAEALAEVGPAGGAGGDDLPREDISSKLTEAFLKDFSSADWKARQAAMTAVDQMIEDAHKRVQSTGTGDLFAALQGRLTDANKNLITTALNTLCNLAKAMGPGVDKASRGILTPVLKTLSDNKKPLREAVAKVLDTWVELLGLEKMLPYLAAGLADPKISADGRKDLYSWLAKQITKSTPSPELAALVKPAAAGLQEKTVEVRKAAEEMLLELAKVCGADVVAKEAKGLPAGTLAVLTPVLEKAKGSGAPPPLAAEDSTGSVKGKISSRPSTPTAAAGAAASTSGRPRTAIPRPGSRGAPGKTMKQLEAEASEAAVAGEALVMPNDGKEERAKKAPRKIKFDDLRVEESDDLQASAKPFFRSDLHKRLFGADFKEQVKGLEQMQKAVPDYVKPLADNLDILLRWSVLRLCDSNTSSLVKTVEFLTTLFEALKAEDYSLTEYEASVFLPCLVEKIGQNSAQVREKMQKLVRAVVCIYPASKLVGYLADGIKSKNNRTRLDCLDEINAMIERHGVEVATPAKVLHQVAGLVLEKDIQIRNKVLEIVATVYKIMGPDALKAFGKVNDQQKAVLDEKFKWKAKDMEKKKEGKPGEARAASRAAKMNGLAGERSEVDPEEEPPRAVTPPRPPPSRGPRSSMTLGGAAFWPGSQPPRPATAPPRPPQPPQNWADACRQIAEARTPEEAVNAMKVICHELSTATAMGDEARLSEYKRNVDGLVQALRKTVSDTFRRQHTSSRGCKYVLNTLMQTFQVRPLAQLVTPDTLRALINELLMWLLDKSVPAMDDGSQLLKALNVLMLKILENASRTYSFAVLIQLLRPEKSTSEDGSIVMVPRHPHFMDLVIKCLIKLTKALGSTIQEINLDEVLFAIAEYMEELGLDEIRRRAGVDDKPLRMVKTVLYELVKLRGEGIKGNLSYVDVLRNPPPIILAYIDMNLQSLAHASRTNASSATSESTGRAEGVSSTQGPAEESYRQQPAIVSNTQVDHNLTAVFRKIGNKETSTIGLYELYRLQKLHPHIDLEAKLAGTSEEFRAYIREGLAKVELTVVNNRATSAPWGARTPPPIITPFNPQPRPEESPQEDPTTTSPARQLFADPPATSSAPPSAPASPPGREVDAYREKMARIGAMGARGEGSGPSTPSRPGSEASSAASSPRPNVASLDALRERMRRIQMAAAGSPPRAGAQSQGEPSFVVQADGGGAMAEGGVATEPVSPPRGDGSSSLTMSSLQSRVQDLRRRNESASMMR